MVKQFIQKFREAVIKGDIFYDILIYGLVK